MIKENFYCFSFLFLCFLILEDGFLKISMLKWPNGTSRTNREKDYKQVQTMVGPKQLLWLLKLQLLIENKLIQYLSKPAHYPITNNPNQQSIENLKRFPTSCKKNLLEWSGTGTNHNWIQDFRPIPILHVTELNHWEFFGTTESLYYY